MLYSLYHIPAIRENFIFKESETSSDIINDRTFFVIVLISTILFVSFESLLIADATFLVPIKIIDGTGDGNGNTLNSPYGIAVDKNDNVYVTGVISDNAFKITPGGDITKIIDSTGDGNGNTLNAPYGIAVDKNDNVYVVGNDSDNAFKITPGGDITEIIDSTGDGNDNTLNAPHSIAVDNDGNVYVTGRSSLNAFKITPSGDITEIIDSTGDRNGNTLNEPLGIAVDNDGNVYVTGNDSDNVFKITPGGDITEIIDSTGDGNDNTLNVPWGIAVDNDGNVYVTGRLSFNAFKITPGGDITKIIDSTGDGNGNTLNDPWGIAVDNDGNVYVTGRLSFNAFKITPGGDITEIIDSTGDGNSNRLFLSLGIAVDNDGNVYVIGRLSNNAFIIPFEVSLPHEYEPKSGGGSDNTHLLKPTFGLYHTTYKPIVDEGFSFNNNTYNITHNWHTPFDVQNVTLGEINSFSAKVYTQNKLMVQEFLFGIPEVGKAYKAELGVEIWYNVTGGIIETKIIQKTNIVDPVSLNVTHSSIQCQSVDTDEDCDITHISMIFLEPLKDDIMAIKAVDFQRRSHTTYLNEGFDISGESLNSMKTQLIAGNQKSEGIIMVTQTAKYSDIWVSDDNREFQRNDYGTFTQINRSFEQHVDSGELRNRSHSEFVKYMDLQSATAQITLEELCPHCNDMSFDKINNTFAYDFPEHHERSDDPVSQELLTYEEHRAKEFLAKMYEHMYRSMIFD